jgi:hypothetical protein
VLRPVEQNAEKVITASAVMAFCLGFERAKIKHFSEVFSARRAVEREKFRSDDRKSGFIIISANASLEIC